MSTFTHYFTTATYFIVGVINLLPGIGVLSNARITSLYQIEVASDDLSLVLRHRAVLLLIVGLLLVVSAWISELRRASGLAGLLSMVSFIVLAWSLPEINPALHRVMLIDCAATVLLLAALILNQRAV